MAPPPPPGLTTPRVPSWIVAVTTLVAGLWVIFNIAYRLGATGVSVSGASAEFEREHDSSLFVVDEAKSIAFDVDEHGVALTRFEPGLIPFRPVCGMHDLAGRALPGFAYRVDRWIYSVFPEMDGADVYDLETGELLAFDPPAPATGEVDLATVPFYAEHGLVRDEGRRVDPTWVAATYEPISRINESCTVFNAAFFLVFFVLGTLALGFLVVALLRRRPAQTVA